MVFGSNPLNRRKTEFETVEKAMCNQYLSEECLSMHLKGTCGESWSYTSWMNMWFFFEKKQNMFNRSAAIRHIELNGTNIHLRIINRFVFISPNLFPYVKFRASSAFYCKLFAPNRLLAASESQSGVNGYFKAQLTTIKPLLAKVQTRL